MPAPITINFRAGGIEDVRKAFRSIGDALALLERGEARVARKGVDAAEKAAREKSRIADREARNEIRATERAARDKQRAEDRASNESIRREARANAARLRAFAAGTRDEVREHERGEREKTRISNQEASRRESRGRASRERMANAVRGGLSSGVNSTFSVGRSAVNLAMDVGGGFSLADAASRRVQAERNAILLSNSAYIPGQTARPDSKTILSHAKGVQASTNTDINELLEGTRGYVAKSSDFKGSMANMEFFAKLAKGTGASFKDVANAAGILKAQNKDLSDKDMREMLLGVVGQGKLGAVELDDLARVAGKITKTSAMYGGKQTETQRKLLGLSQIAIKTSGSPDEAATVISNFGQDVLKHQKEIGNVTNKNGELNDPAKVIGRIFEKSGGNLGNMMGLGMGQRSMKLLDALAPIYREATDAAKKANPKASEADVKKAGVAAVEAEVNKNTGASYSEGDMLKDFGEVMSSSAEKFEAAVTQLKEKVADELVPALNKMIPVIERLGPAIAGLLEFVSNHPIAAAGAIIAAQLTKSIAAAGIGELIRNLLTGKGGGLPGVGGVGPGGAALAVAAGVALAAGTGNEVIDAAGEGTNAGVKTASDLAHDIAYTRNQLKHGDITPEEADAKLRKFKGATATAEEGADTAHAALAGASAPLALVSADARKDIAEYNKNKVVADHADELAAAMKKLKAEIETTTASVNSAKRGFSMAGDGRKPSNWVEQ